MWKSIVMAQDAPLFIQGGLEDATINDDTYNTGGTIVVNGFSITVPSNMLVQFPAAWVPFKDFVEEKDSMLGYEINVCGAALLIFCVLSARSKLSKARYAPGKRLGPLALPMV
jgi:hypothetical protein